jgi:hypothetical protein
MAQTCWLRWNFSRRKSKRKPPKEQAPPRAESEMRDASFDFKRALRSVASFCRNVIDLPEPKMREIRRALRKIFAGLLACALPACTELPNDMGVRPHRQAAKTYHRVFSAWYDDPTAKGETKILINLTTQQAFFYRGDTIIGRTGISSGRREYETPPGKYRVIQKDERHVSSEYGVYVNRAGAVILRDASVNRGRLPRGARFVGAPMPYFLRFRDGYGMHAGFVPRFRASHGCVRMPVKMAKHFFDAAEIGTRVEVIEPPVMVER